MYFNPSWSHAHSAFAVALFFWYWLRTRENRTLGQWLVLAWIAGLMMDVYYPNALVLAILIPEALANYRAAWTRSSDQSSTKVTSLVAFHLLFCAVLIVSLLPTFLTRYFVYGGFFQTGYIPVSEWSWTSPWFLSVLFSANHGLFSWTPILLLAAVGLFLFSRNFPAIAVSVLCVFLVFYYCMASYPDWHGISSYGNRFFVSLTVFFVLGLAVLLDAVASLFRCRAVASALLAVALSTFVVWNLGLIFQWGAHLIPSRGPISWSTVVYNQFHVVPRQTFSQLQAYLFRRKETLHQIEQRDAQELKRSAPP
jgi:hypothetical protein